MPAIRLPGAPTLRLVWNREFERRAAALFARFRDGEVAEDFASLVGEIAPLLVPLVRSRLRRIGRHLDARELVQDTFTQVYQARSTFHDRGPGSFVKWFLAIADNLVRQDSRADQRRVRREQVVALPVADRCADPFSILLKGEEELLTGLSWAQVRRLALEAVQALPPSQWEVFVRYCRERLSYDDLATQLGLPRGAVVMRIQRARESVLHYIEARLADGTFESRVSAMARALH